MHYLRTSNTIVCRLETGENIHDCLLTIAAKENIRLATITGIGALQSALLSFFDLKEKKYHSSEWKEDLEIVSLNGNLTLMEGKPYLHIHAALGDRNFKTYSGHLQEGVIGATGEIFITMIDGEVSRKKDEGTGLNFMEI